MDFMCEGLWGKRIEQDKHFLIRLISKKSWLARARSISHDAAQFLMRAYRQFSLVMLFTAFSLLFAPPQMQAAKVVLVAGGGIEKTGPAAQCKLTAPFGVDFDHAGNVYVVEMEHGEPVLKVDRRGSLSIFAGTGEKRGSGDV